MGRDYLYCTPGPGWSQPNASHTCLWLKERCRWNTKTLAQLTSRHGQPFGNVKLTAMSCDHHCHLYLTAIHEIFDDREGNVNVPLVDGEDSGQEHQSWSDLPWRVLTNRFSLNYSYGLYVMLNSSGSCHTNISLSLAICRY